MTIFGPAEINFEFVKGTTFLPDAAPFTLRHKATQVALDLTGATANMTLRDSTTGALIIALTESGSPNLVLGGVAGTVKPDVPKATTDTWTSTKIDYDLWVDGYDGGSDNRAFVCGVISLKVSPSSTQ